MKNMTNITEMAFQIILHAGDDKTKAMEAIKEAKRGHFDNAEQLIENAGRELGKAHKYQTELLQKEANGEENLISVILIHSQDHLMTSMTVKELAAEFINVYKELSKK